MRRLDVMVGKLRGRTYMQAKKNSSKRPPMTGTARLVIAGGVIADVGETERARAEED